MSNLTCEEIAIRKYYSKWLSHCRGLKKNNEDGEDLLHNVLAELHEKGRMKRLACEEVKAGDMNAYVCRMIWTRHISDCRRAKIEMVRDFNPESIAESPINIEVAGGRQYEQMDIYIEWLSEYETELILFSKLPGFTVKAMSEVMEISPKTIRIDLRNAKKKIKEYVHNTAKNQE